MKQKTKIINLYITPGTFAFLFRRTGDYDFSELSQLRQVLSNERAKILNIIKTKKPESIYSLTKISGRDFKSVKNDLSILEKFGIISLEKGEKGRRKKLKPVLEVDKLQINFDFS
jgi:predicted transcriptional regulator